MLAVLDQVLPKSPWRRVGSKGAIRLWLQRSARLPHQARRRLDDPGVPIEGRADVLPPSIHPDTLRPYVANIPLLDVVAVVPSCRLMSRSSCAKPSVRGHQLARPASPKISSFGAVVRDNALVVSTPASCRGRSPAVSTRCSTLSPRSSTGSRTTPRPSPWSVEKAQAKVVEFLVRDVTGRRTLPRVGTTT